MDRAGHTRVTAEARIGEKLREMPKATGTRGKIAEVTGGPRRGPPEDAPTLRDIWLSKNRSSQAQKLAAVPKPKVDFAGR